MTTPPIPSPLRQSLPPWQTLFNPQPNVCAPLRAAQADELAAYTRRLVDLAPPPFHPDYANPEAFTRSADPLREHLARTLGYPPPGDVPPPDLALAPLAEDDLCTYHRYTLEVLPAVHAVGLYLVPKHAAGPRPLVIAQHGGEGSPEIATFHGGANYHDMVRGAVAQGFVVAAPMLLFKTPDHPQNIRELTDARLRQVGTSLTALEIHKITRTLTALQARPEIDPARIAMIGLSYGGQYALLTTALEPRICAAVVSCYPIFNNVNFADPFAMPDRHWPTSATRLLNHHLAALICPRPLHLQHGLSDTIVPPIISREMAEGVRPHYDALNLLGHLQYAEFDGQHEFRSGLAWPFLQKHLYF